MLAVAFSALVTANLKALAAVMPHCGLNCMISSIAESSCATTEQASTKNVSMTACSQPVRDRTKIVSIAGVMLVTPLSALSVVLADIGLGKDIWTLPSQNITRILKIYFYDECIYLSILPLTKISILFFYLRVFPKRSFRDTCRPLPGARLHWDGEHEYQCNSINAQGWAAAIFNMVLDLVVMLMPLHELYHLQLSLRKKALMMTIFSLGIFVTLVSILRLESLIHFASTDNLTWDYVEIGYWSTIEVHVGIIYACLPAIRSLLTRIYPSIFGDTRVQTSTSRSGDTSYRVEAAISSKPKGDDSDFLSLVDTDSSSRFDLERHR
ncbi:hypothetical protein BDV29DRAFT_160660 [Aspergillus leporis]|uniref:Rhodopsin domain-containing protein n=1 Tax=Aspergillus leporis TaxID=41062 RepID=A0A5N5WSX4_9EURO|nr:hypothetical protein BDV29DRAFT_160660 [Aspergillus leporis]